MADDIVTRLRAAVCWCNEYDGVCHVCEAADEIERLRQQVDSLSKQLDRVVSRD